MPTFIYTNPKAIEVASSEKVPVDVEFAALLEVGQTLSAPSTVLRDLSRRSLFAAGLSGSPEITGTKVRQILTGLTAGTIYRLETTAVLSQNTTRSVWTLIECPALEG